MATRREKNSASEREEPLRGVTPRLLLDQVRITAPFVFEGDAWDAYPYAIVLREAAVRLRSEREVELSHVEYFELCLAAHHATVGTYVPTDVDGQIRSRLFHPSLETATVVAMADTVLASHGWDCRPVSARWTTTPGTDRILSGHLGEWFSTAVAAYGALRTRDPARAEQMADTIVEEVHHHAEAFEALRGARDGIGLLKASAVIAHNLGDLDRVIELWSLAPDDPLRLGWPRHRD